MSTATIVQIEAVLDQLGIDVMGDDVYLECEADSVHYFYAGYLTDEDGWLYGLVMRGTMAVDGEFDVMFDWYEVLTAAVALGFTEPVDFSIVRR